MANAFLNNQVYANVMLLLLKNQLVMGKLVDGQFKDEVTDENGLIINVKRPPRFVAINDGTANLVTQDVVTGSMPLSVTQYAKVHIGIGDIEWVQSWNQLMRNQSMLSAASTLAHYIDSYIASQLLSFNCWQAGATPANGGSTNATDPTKGISSSSEAMGAHTRLMSNGVPDDGSLSGILGYLDGEMIRGSQMASFTPDINVSMLERVRIPLISTVNWYATQQLPKITLGTRTQGNGSSTGATINGANQNVNYRDVAGSAGVAGLTQTLAITGGGANATIAAGEVFTIQNVYSWDWRAQKIQGHLQQFTVVNAVTLNGSGAGTLTISPAIIVQGTNDATSTSYTNSAFGTVGTVPASGAYVEFVGAASAVVSVRAAWHRRGISLVSARLATPFTGESSFAVDPDTGISVRYWRGSDISTGKHYHRWDCMFGAAVLDNFLGTRLCGT